MTYFKAIVLGLVQGATEFLPVSSTAHLRIIPAFLGWADPGAAFTAVLQLGSLVAILGYFFRELATMIPALWDRQARRGPQGRWLLMLIVGTLPIGIAGLALKDIVEGPLRALWIIATALIVVGVLLAIVERTARHSRGMEAVNMRDALVVGLGQTLALIPGVSRSGITLVTGMSLGLKRDAAARFSFLLSVPAVTAAGLFELPEVLNAGDVPTGPLLMGLLTAAISSYLSIAWLLRFLRTRTTIPFVAYRVVLGAAILLQLAAF